MSATVIDISQVSGALEKEARRHRNAVEQAKRGAAMKLKAHLVGAVRGSGITDMGGVKNGFRAGKDRVWNEAAHFIFIELGTRPHKVSLAGIEAIAAWVRRKLGIRGKKHRWQKRDADTGQFSGIHDDAYDVARAIAKKIEKYGSKAHYFMRDALPFALKFYAEELERIIRRGIK